MNTKNPKPPQAVDSTIYVDFISQILDSREVSPGTQTDVGQLTITCVRNLLGIVYLGSSQNDGGGSTRLNLGSWLPSGTFPGGSVVHLMPTLVCRSVAFDMAVNGTTYTSFFRRGQLLLEREYEQPPSLVVPVEFSDDAGFTHLIITSPGWSSIEKMTFVTLA
jgi:hypothetical protein